MPGINRSGNNKNVLKTPVKTRWECPALSPGSSSRIFTKHYTNLVLCLEENELALFSFLIYQAETDNTIKYSTKLLLQYSKAVDLIGEKYKAKILKISVPYTRPVFKRLIEQGLLLPTGNAKVYMVNPNFSYVEYAVMIKFYNSWTQLYRAGNDLKELTTLYRDHVWKKK